MYEGFATTTDASPSVGFFPAPARQIEHVAVSHWADVIDLADVEWLTHTVHRVEEIRSTGANWDSYGSPPLTAAAYEQTFAIISLLARARVPQPDLAPVSGGGLQFTWTLQDRSVELEVLPDGSIEVLKVLGPEHMVEGAVPQSEGAILGQIAWLFA